ncbi:hypothetical protein BDV25DRAFT_165099 [Aspergillus avenaceus]|uniref:Uncharacterized protein n=1 Tax=Aspergillus avenaceus TaxID=36643 RepID=A0A5N6TFU4_ASPAV|nr:hypothetical protein BDV25DRAFT_165099 [Aspergillus avenaceus]
MQHLRDLFNSDRNRDTSARALETLNQEIEEYRFGRARNRSTLEQTRATLDQRTQQPPSRPNLQRLHASLSVAGTDSDSNNPDLFGSSRRILGGDSVIREERGQFISPSQLILQPSVDMSQETDEDRRRVKRRKLESDDKREGLQCFRYGQFGQVVPGTLQMELASCDGGTYETGGESSWPENILRNDSSVYCTKSDRCNLILKHRGETPFCLKKIVIKAPKSGYDAPIQEGMVFVSMASDELLAHTAQYQIQYTPSQRNRRSWRPGTQPSQEYLNAYRHPLQALTGRDPHPGSDTDLSEPVEFNAGHRLDPITEFSTTTDYDEHLGAASRGSGNDIPSLVDLESQQFEDDLLCSDSDESDSDDDPSELGMYNRRRRELLRRVRSMRRRYALEQNGQPRRRPVPSTVQPIPQSAPSNPGTGSDVQHASIGLLRPHARFFIERTKSMVSIKFDPPPSGRYILIKLWSPHNGSNIDIQSIIVHGYAGPRFFPSGGFR